MIVFIVRLLNRRARLHNVYYFVSERQLDADNNALNPQLPCQLQTTLTNTHMWVVMAVHLFPMLTQTFTTLSLELAARVSHPLKFALGRHPTLKAATLVLPSLPVEALCPA